MCKFQIVLRLLSTWSNGVQIGKRWIRCGGEAFPELVVLWGIVEIGSRRGLEKRLGTETGNLFGMNIGVGKKLHVLLSLAFWEFWLKKIV